MFRDLQEIEIKFRRIFVDSLMKEARVSDLSVRHFLVFFLKIQRERERHGD